VGVIINPTISAKAITGSETYAAQVRGGPRHCPNTSLRPGQEQLPPSASWRNNAGVAHFAALKRRCSMTYVPNDSAGVVGTAQYASWRGSGRRPLEP
jgi:hypothetical protein